MGIPKRRLVQVIAGVGMALGIIASASTPALANGPTAYASGGAGWAWYEEYGDYWHIRDTKADGHSAVVQWRISSGREGDDWDNNGADNGTTVINRNYPEEDTVQYRACWGEWGSQYIEISSCSTWVTTQA
ncbi:hypothetical protein [Plantactinospora sp. DSM 117369]